jgi:hypothetical protein
MKISRESFQAYNTCKPEPSFSEQFNKKHKLGDIRERIVLLILALGKDTTKHIELTEQDVINAGHTLEHKLIGKGM